MKKQHRPDHPSSTDKGHQDKGHSHADADNRLTNSTVVKGVPEPKLETAEAKKRGGEPTDSPPDRLNKIWHWLKDKAVQAGLHDWLMVVFTGVLTFVAICQFVVGFKTTNLLSDRFVLEQRPWVGFQSPICEACKTYAEPVQKLGPLHFYQKQHLTITDLKSEVVNTGKSPASDVVIHHTIVSLPKAAPIPTWDSFTRQWAFANKDFPRYSEGILGTSDPVFDLPPTITHRVHLVEMPTMPYWRDVFGKEQDVVYVLGEIDYIDPSTKEHHRTTLCLWDEQWTSDQDAFTYCPTGNTMN